MKKLLILLCLLVMPLYIINAETCEISNGNYKSGSVSVSNTNLTLTKDKSTTISLNATCTAGRIDVKSSDNSVVSVSPSSDFADNSSINIVLTAKKSGSAVVTITLSDMADYAGNVITGTKKVNVKVLDDTSTKIEEQSQTNPNTSNQTQDDTDKKVEVVNEMKVTSFKIVGYDINFDPNTYEYTIDVSENVNKLYVIVSGENFETSGDKEVDIQGKDSIIITLSNKDDVRNYTVHINRIQREIIKTETKEIEKEVLKTNNLYLYTTIGLGVLCLMLLILLISKKKAKTSPSLPSATEVSNITPSTSSVSNTSTIEIVDFDLTNSIPTVNPNINQK